VLWESSTEPRGSPVSHVPYARNVAKYATGTSGIAQDTTKCARIVVASTSRPAMTGRVQIVGAAASPGRDIRRAMSGACRRMPGISKLDYWQPYWPALITGPIDVGA
jgi:hypothetical protein